MRGGRASLPRSNGGLTSTSDGHDPRGGSGIEAGLAAEGELGLVGRRGSSGE